MSNMKKRSMSSGITRPLPKISTPSTRAKFSPISFQSNTTTVLKSKPMLPSYKSRIVTEASKN